MQSLKLTSEKIEALQSFPFLQDSVPQLQAELPTYLAAIKDVELTTDEQKLEWWSRQTEVPGWSGSCVQVVGSSALVGSVRKGVQPDEHTFNKQQEHSLESTI